MKEMWKYVGIAVANVVLMMGMYLFGVENRKDDEGWQKVTRVIDGDTIELESKQQIRLNNLKTPEEGMCGYEEAKSEMEKLAMGKVVKVEGEFVDDWGRLLGLVYTKDYLVNLEMVESGWGKYNSNPTKERDRIREAGAEARKNNLGLFEMCRQDENGENQECLIKGNNRDGYETHIYTFPGCMNYSNVIIDKDAGDGWFCSEEEAVEAGYVKAENCFGKEWKSEKE